MNQYWSLKRAVLVGTLTSTHYIMQPVLIRSVTSTGQVEVSL